MNKVKFFTILSLVIALLRAMQTAGVIKFFLREVPFDLPGHYENGRIVRHYVDFMVVYQDMTVKF